MQPEFDLQLPAFVQLPNPVNNPLPANWQCTALLHPFSPPPGPALEPTPFFQLCTADITYAEGIGMFISVSGEDGRMWFYLITPTETRAWQEGRWNAVDMGWSLPTTQWLVPGAQYVGSSYLNWMNAQPIDWWKMPVPIKDSLAATWIWCQSEGERAGFPFRLMFGQPPQSPVMGDPNQLAFFQMFSFTYLCNFRALPAAPDFAALVPGESGAGFGIEGFAFGNPAGYEKFVWNPNFGMTALMTPVKESVSPFPTQVLYNWAADASYQVLTDRAQLTTMHYTYNPALQEDNEQIYMYGVVPTGSPVLPHSGMSFVVDTMLPPAPAVCNILTAGGGNLGLQAPDWVSSAGEEGTIHACIASNPELCPDQNIMITSVLFPPAYGYTQGRYLWTWYSPFADGSQGRNSRPVTFMESASNIDEGGTDLALADYFDYQNFGQPLDPTTFKLPSVCNNVKQPSEA
jgi:hypothetical protein